MNKAGTGHVEVIISFVLFIGFLAFILITFNPLKGPPNPAIVNSVYNVLEDNLSVELNKVSINLNDITGQSCFILKDSGNLISDLKCNNNNIFVKDQDNNRKYAEIVSNKIVSALNPSKNFYTIYCSDEIDPITGNFENPNLCNEYSQLSVVYFLNNSFGSGGNSFFTFSIYSFETTTGCKSGSGK